MVGRKEVIPRTIWWGELNEKVISSCLSIPTALDFKYKLRKNFRGQGLSLYVYKDRDLGFGTLDWQWYVFVRYEFSGWEKHKFVVGQDLEKTFVLARLTLR